MNTLEKVVNVIQEGEERNLKSNVTDEKHVGRHSLAIFRHCDFLCTIQTCPSAFTQPLPALQDPC